MRKKMALMTKLARLNTRLIACGGFPFTRGWINMTKNSRLKDRLKNMQAIIAKPASYQFPSALTND